MSWKPEVQVAGEPGKWHGNQLRFATKDEAEKNVRDLASRWLQVVETRVAHSSDPVNYRWDDPDGLVRVIEEEE